jgi:hypothetical protein
MDEMAWRKMPPGNPNYYFSDDEAKILYKWIQDR